MITRILTARVSALLRSTQQRGGRQDPARKVDLGWFVLL